MTNIIGFAEKFYTLWQYEVKENFVANSQGNKYCTSIITTFTFVKNVSMSLEVVKSLYPKTEIDLTLRGKTTVLRTVKKDLPSEFFWFGKYYGQKIDDIIESDFNYCIWAKENTNTPYLSKHHKILAHFEAKKQKTNDLLKVGDTIEVEFLSNASFDYGINRYYTQGKYNNISLIVLCEVEKTTGNIAVINSKAQRTKGKKITICIKEVLESFSYDGNTMQTVSIV